MTTAVVAVTVASAAACKPATTSARVINNGGHAVTLNASGHIAKYDDEPVVEEAGGPIKLASDDRFCVTWIKERGSTVPVLGDPVLLEPCVPKSANQYWSAVRTEGGIGLIQIPGTQYAIGWKGALDAARLVDDSGNDPAVTFVTNFIPTPDAYEVEMHTNGFSYLAVRDLPRAGVSIYPLIWAKFRDTDKFHMEWFFVPWERVSSQQK